MTQNNAIAFEVHLAEQYDQALERVAAALQQEGFGILTRIDVDKTLKEKLNADFRPYAILGACNPPLALRALDADPAVGLMLPCNVTVEAGPDDGDVTVRIADPVTLLTASGFGGTPELAAVAGEARARLMRVAQALR